MNNFEPSFDDVERGRLCAILCYLVPVVPYIIMSPKSEFAKFHANVSLWVFVLSILSFLIIPSLVALFLWVFGLVQAFVGKADILFFSDLAKKYPNILLCIK